jgi:hypothetical protein
MSGREAAVLVNSIRGDSVKGDIGYALLCGKIA